MGKANFGLVGLGVMGHMLALNIERNGFRVAGYDLDAAKAVVPAKDIFVIIGHEAERVRDAMAGTGVQFILQAEQLGTGHAIMSARQALAAYDDVLVLSGDVPLLRACAHACPSAPGPSRRP